MSSKIKLYEFIVKKLRPQELAMLVKQLMAVKRFIYELPDKHKFFIDPMSDFGLTLLKDNCYEKEMTNEIELLLKPGDSFIDLGGNEGYFSIIASKLIGQNGKVITIEPQQRLWHTIIQNVAINNCENIQLLPIGIGSKRGVGFINLYTSLNTGASSLAPNFNFKVSMASIRKKIYGQQKICIKTLDELAPTFPNVIKLIKIDIEGFEFEAIKGSENLLKKHVLKNILIETHLMALTVLEQHENDLINYIVKFGYSKKIINNNLLLFTVKDEDTGN